MTETPPSKASERPDYTLSLEDELSVLGPESAERLLAVMRGLFQCIGDLNERVAELEKRLGE